MVQETLPGGNSNRVTRIGDTVRRTAGPWTPTVHAYLRSIRSHGVLGVPEPVGIDEGQESLSYLEGEVANYPLPGWLWSETILRDCGRFLRSLHDASVGFALPEASWQTEPHEPREVVCHNDFAPYNLVFRDGVLVGAIDFDTASPGPRIRDLAYLAYRLVPFVSDAGPDAPPEPGRPARLDALIEAYGLPFSRGEVLTAMGDRLEELARFTDARAAETGNHEFTGHAALYRRDAAEIRALRLPS